MIDSKFKMVNVKETFEPILFEPSKFPIQLLQKYLTLLGPGGDDSFESWKLVSSWCLIVDHYISFWILR